MGDAEACKLELLATRSVARSPEAVDMEVDDSLPDSGIPRRLAPLSCVLGDLSQADGSASLTHGNTSVLAAVYGPCEVKMSKEILNKATVEVIFKPKVGLPNCADKYREHHVSEVFQSSLMVYLHPRSSITIVLQELEDDEAFLATSINAACLAALDAGVSMKFLVAAVTAVIDTAGTIALMPALKPVDAEVAATVLLVFSDKDYGVVGASSTGKFTQDQYDECVSLCRQASKEIFKYYRESVEKKLSKSL